MIRSSPALVAVVAVLALGGCGGGGSDPSTGGSTTSSGEARAANASLPPWDRHRSGPAPGSKEFIEKADAICRRGKREGYRTMIAYLKQLPRSGGSVADRLLKAIQVAYLPRVEVQVEEIHTLAPPKGEGWQVTAFLVALREGIRSERRTAINPRFDRSFEHSAELANVLGIKDCVYDAGVFNE